MHMDFVNNRTCQFIAELTIKNNILVDVSKGFCNMTGFSSSDFMHKSLSEVFMTLKASFKNILNLNGTHHGYIFSKDLDAIETELHFEIKSYNVKTITFIEKSFCRISQKLSYACAMCKDNISATAVYEVPDLLLLNASKKFIEYFTFGNKQLEYHLGKSIKDSNINSKHNILNNIFQQVFETQKTVVLKAFSIETASHEFTYWETTATPIFEFYTIKYIIINCIDVTEKVMNKRQAEDQARVISEQNKLLQNTLMEQEEFFSNMSHELKTPINVIFSALQVLQLYYNDNRAIKYYKIMKQNCYRLLRLINNLIDMSKIDSGYLNLNLGNYNIVEIIEDITLSVAEFIEEKGISLIFDTDIEEKLLTCDPDKIERIILNLLSNAIKFTNPDGQIKVNIYDNQSFINVVVEDTGIGMPEDKLKLIFDRFKQVDKALPRNYEGSGIGLSLVKSLVELQGGTIEVSSILGKGSRFSIIFPVQINEAYSPFHSHEGISSNIERIHLEFSDIYSLTE